MFEDIPWMKQSALVITAIISSLHGVFWKTWHRCRNYVQKMLALALTSDLISAFCALCHIYTKGCKYRRVSVCLSSWFLGKVLHRGSSASVGFGTWRTSKPGDSTRDCGLTLTLLTAIANQFNWPLPQFLPSVKDKELYLRATTAQLGDVWRTT